MHTTFKRVAGLTALAGFSVGSLFAIAPRAAAADEQDPGVARISLLDGGVDVKRADSGDSFSAAVNAPLNAGDYLTTQNDARAELQLDDETELRVAPATQLRFTNLTATANALQLAEGTVELRLLHGTDANPEIDTPNASIRPSENGAYRISVDDNGNAIVTVRAGSATVALQNASQDITEGNSVAIDGDAQNAQIQSVPTIADDEFDAFNVARDSKEAGSQSYAYVDDQVVGANDLDHYGSWQNTSDYGEVWHPNTAANWAPYSDGNWTWEPYYGWTWVSAEPWGWAPYHYGRWFYASDDGGWCWTPATQYVRPAYAPAQVAFFSFGFGHGGGISIGFGNVGWTPLGPRDAFSPWWGGYDGNGYGRGGYGGNGGNTTIANITNVTNIYNYHNVNAPGGIVAVGNANFQHGDFRQRVNVTPAQLRLANIAPVRGIVPVLPTTRNLAFDPRATAPAVAAPLSPNFRHLKPVAASLAQRPFTEQRAAVSALAQHAYPNQARTFAQEAPALSEASPQNPSTHTTAPATRGRSELDSTTARQREPEYANPQRTTTQRRAGSPWDRFDSAGAAGSRTTPDIAPGHPAQASGASESAGRDVARPSYARPDTATASSRVLNTTPQRSTSDAWDRFGSSSRTNTDGDTARPSYARPQTAPTNEPYRRTNSAPAHGEQNGTENARGDDAPVRRSYAPAAQHDGSPAATREDYRPTRTDATERQKAEPHSGSDGRSAPVPHSAPAEHPRPAEAQPHAVSAHPKSDDRDHH